MRGYHPFPRDIRDDAPNPPMKTKSVIRIFLCCVALLGPMARAGFVTPDEMDDRPEGVPPACWVPLFKDLGFVRVPPHSKITGYVSIDGNRIPLIATTSEGRYFVVRTPEGWRYLPTLNAAEIESRFGPVF